MLVTQLIYLGIPLFLYHAEDNSMISKNWLIFTSRMMMHMESKSIKTPTYYTCQNLCELLRHLAWLGKC